MSRLTLSMLMMSVVFSAVCGFAIRSTSGAEPTTKKTNFVVAQDGTGDYKMILEAINAAPQLTSHDAPFEIQIKPGLYKELIYIQREKRFIKLIGEDPATTKIIFGAATEWYENCEIHALGNGYLTAASTEENTPFGLIFSHCKITAESPDVKTFLGRPWRAFASTIFLNSEMADCIRPEGWNNWGNKQRQTTARYAEFNSSGPGGNATDRAPWAKQLSAQAASAITIQNVFGDWKP